VSGDAVRRGGGSNLRSQFAASQNTHGPLGPQFITRFAHPNHDSRPANLAQRRDKACPLSTLRAGRRRPEHRAAANRRRPRAENAMPNATAKCQTRAGGRQPSQTHTAPRLPASKPACQKTANPTCTTELAGTARPNYDSKWCRCGSARLGGISSSGPFYVTAAGGGGGARRPPTANQRQPASRAMRLPVFFLKIQLIITKKV
jgi:hypothetical protein